MPSQHLSCFFLIATVNVFDRGIHHRVTMTFVGYLSAAIIAAIIWCPNHPLKPILEWQPLRWVGMISYGVYLWHVPIFHVIEPLKADPILKSAIGLCATFAIATVSFYVMERPLLRLKDRIGHSSTMPQVASAQSS